MTNLKAGSGPTSEPVQGSEQVQGPHSGLILGVARWSSNRLFVDPEQSLKFLVFFVVLELAFWQGVKWARIRLSSIYIYIFLTLDRSGAHVLAKTGFFLQVYNQNDPPKCAPQSVSKYAFFGCP